MVHSSLPCYPLYQYTSYHLAFDLIITGKKKTYWLAAIQSSSFCVGKVIYSGLFSGFSRYSTNTGVSNPRPADRMRPASLF